MGQRDAYFDNAKFLLIALVVLGHFFTTLTHHHEILKAMYKTIYSFHMPAFILLSGVFAKGFYEKGYLVKLIRRIIVPYFTFQIIYTIYYYFLYDHSTFSLDFLMPQWSLWFLLSLFCWYILLLGYAKLNPFIGIGLSIIIALLVGYLDSIANYVSLSRTLVFFPFLLIGYHLGRERLKQFIKPSIHIVSFVFILIVLVGFYLDSDFSSKWLYGSKPYGEIETVTALSMLKRLGVMCVSFLMIFCFLSFVPRKQYFFTKWGKQTLYVYLLQGFIIKYFRESEWEKYFDGIGSFIILTAISILVTIILSSKVVAAIAQPFIEFKISRLKQLFKPRTTKEAMR
jgi:fucose 4-O-acetylase-like acetyltransferase